MIVLSSAAFLNNITKRCTHNEQYKKCFELVLTTTVQFFKSLQLKSCTPVLPLLLLLPETSLSLAISVVSDWPIKPMTGDCSTAAVVEVAAPLCTVLAVAAVTACNVL